MSLPRLEKRKDRGESPTTGGSLAQGSKGLQEYFLYAMLPTLSLCNERAAIL
jgi:hypothetical protein